MVVVDSKELRVELEDDSVFLVGSGATLVLFVYFGLTVGYTNLPALLTPVWEGDVWMGAVPVG